MELSNEFERSYRVKAYFVLGVAMFMFFQRLISASMLSQMNHPLFLFGDAEWFYKAFIASGIPQFITANTVVSALLDVAPLVLAIGFLMSLNRWFIVAFWLVVLNYFLTYNSVTGHHYHGMIGLLAITLTFWFKRPEKFEIAWDLVRYYLLYIFVSAALWKILRGAVFYDLQLTDILKAQQINLLLQNPDSFKAHIAQYLIANPGVSHLVLIVNVLVQAVFVTGFFTKKFDGVLFALSIIFCLANYFVMGILSFELLILSLTLLNWQKVEAWLIKQGTITA